MLMIPFSFPQYMSEKLGNQKGSQLDEDFVELEKVR